jgi:hypothetical protein
VIPSVLRQRRIVSLSEIMIQKAHSAARGHVESAEYVEQRRFSRARCSQENDELSGEEIQVYLMKGLNFYFTHPVGLCETSYPEYSAAVCGARVLIRPRGERKQTSDSRFFDGH